MAEQTAYNRARHRAKSKFEFYRHLAVFVVVMLCLIILNRITSPEYNWYVWPLVIWGAVVVLHGASAFFLPGEEEVIERLTEKELQDK